MPLTHAPGPPKDGGQIIVVFALALVALIAMVGLVLDGGSAFSQRRSEQNAADLAALAGANTFLLTADESVATAAAISTAASNGYVSGSGGVDVAVRYDYTMAAAVVVTVTAPHRNTFAGIVGQPIWQVSATATALTGLAPDTASAAGPMIFSIDVFGSNGQPSSEYGDPENPFAFGLTNGDIPTGAGDIAWTNYGSGNVDSARVRDIITGDLVVNKTLRFGEYIGQENNGYKNTLWDDMNVHLAGTDVPVPVVDHNGNFQGWATFHIVSATGSSDKQVTGYFVSPFQSLRLTVGCQLGDCPRHLGSYSLRLVN